MDMTQNQMERVMMPRGAGIRRRRDDNFLEFTQESDGAPMQPTVVQIVWMALPNRVRISLRALGRFLGFTKESGGASMQPTEEQRERMKLREGAKITNTSISAGSTAMASSHLNVFTGVNPEDTQSIIRLEFSEVNVKPIKMECCKKVGVEGGKLQLDSFGIELDIPPGAIDSEAPQDISLRALTDTSNLGNNKGEMSICFGVQCLAPDDLVLKLPVTYTIPHCAVSSRYSSVEAVLYTGEGEYSPDAVVKERIVLSKSGTPSVIIKKDVLILKMNHFSWAKVKFIISQFFFREKRMCCRPFKEKNLALQSRTVILHAHLYDDIKGNSELVKLEEREYFIPANMEQRLSIRTAEGALKMTCYLRNTVIGGPAVVSFDKLMSGKRICVPFELDFTNQSEDSVAVSLKVERNENLEVDFIFRLEDRRQGASPQDQASAGVVAATGVVPGDDAAQGGGGPTSDIRIERTTETNDGNRSSTIFSWTGISNELIPYFGIVVLVGVGLFFLQRRKN